MKIRTKLLIAPFASVAIIAVGGFFIFHNLQSIIQINQVHTIEMEELNAIDTLSGDIYGIRNYIGEVLLGEDRENELINSWEFFESDINKLNEVVSNQGSGKSNGEKESLDLLGKIRTKKDLLRQQIDQIMTDFAAGNVEAAKEGYERIDTTFVDIEETVADMRKDSGREIVETQVGIDYTQRTSEAVTAVLFGAIIIIEIFLAIINASMISKTLAQLQEIISEVLKGNLDKRVEKISDDEIGELAKSFNEMTENLKNKEMVVAEEKQTLHKEIEELSSWQRVAIGRELKMIELKKKVAELEKNKNSNKN